MNLIVDELYDVEVLKISNKGLIVKLEDNSTELIHISRISSSYVRNLEDIFKVGDTYEAKAVKGIARPVELSLVHLNLVSTTQAMQSVHKNSKTNKQKLSLDEMIENCNRDFKDKTKHMKFNNRRNQNNKC